MLSKPNDSFSVGDIVDWSSNKFLVVDIDENEQIQTKGTIQLCNNTLNFYIQNHFLTQIPCVILDKQNINTEENKYLSTIDCDILVLITNNQTNNLISPDDIFKIGRWNYYVTKPDDITKPGLIVLPMKFSEEEQESHLFELTILNGNSIQIAQSQLLTINCILTDNGVVVDSPTLLYSSSNTSIATISNTGEVTILGLGTVSFMVSMSNDNTVDDSIDVEIVADETHNYTVEISGLTSIIKGYTNNYNCVFKDNGNIIVNTSEFYLTGDDGVSETTLAEIISQDSVANTCIVKGLGLGYVKLWVKNVDETITSESFMVQIKNIF